MTFCDRDNGGGGGRSCEAPPYPDQILKCEKLYHGEIGVINRTFRAARRTRVVDRQVARLLF